MEEQNLETYEDEIGFVSEQLDSLENRIKNKEQIVNKSLDKNKISTAKEKEDEKTRLKIEKNALIKKKEFLKSLKEQAERERNQKNTRKIKKGFGF